MSRGFTNPLFLLLRTLRKSLLFLWASVSPSPGSLQLLYNEVMKRTDSSHSAWVRIPAFPFLAVWLQASHETHLCLSCTVCEMGTTSQDCGRPFSKEPTPTARLYTPCVPCPWQLLTPLYASLHVLYSTANYMTGCLSMFIFSLLLFSKNINSMRAGIFTSFVHWCIPKHLDTHTPFKLWEL